MPKVRTDWGRRTYLFMVSKGIEVKDVAEGVGITPQYAASVIYGRVDSPKARKRISDFLGISDSDDPDD